MILGDDSHTTGERLTYLEGACKELYDDIYALSKQIDEIVKINIRMADIFKEKK